MLVKRLTGIVMLLLLALGMFGCSAIRANQAMQAKADKLKVVTSFFTLTDFTQQIGKRNVSVTNIMPAGADHHEFEPSLQQRAALEEADLLIVNGLGMEHWLEDVKRSLGADGPTVVVVGEAIDNANLIANDSHVWLDPALATLQVEQIAEALIKADPQHESEYIANRNRYTKKLQGLDTWAHDILKTAKGKTLVVSHGAFGYLARAYGLKQLAILGVGSEVEPNPQQLATIIERCRAEGISHIYIDEQEHSKAAETIAKEVGAVRLPLYSGAVINAEQSAQGIGYLELMRTNIQNISESLGGSN